MAGRSPSQVDGRLDDRRKEGRKERAPAGVDIFSSTEPDQSSIKITLTRNDDGWWTARDETRGLTTQGETRDEALANLDDVIDAVENDAGRPPTDDELREAGIDPEANQRAGSGELPDVLK